MSRMISNNGNVAITSMKTMVFALTIVLACFIVESPAASSRETELVTKLTAAAERGDEAQCSAICEEMTKCGKEIVPALRASLKSATNQVKALYIHVLNGVGGDESTGMLLEICLDRSEEGLSEQALGSLYYRPINKVLTKEEISVLARMLLDESIFTATTAAQVLSRCQKNDTILLMQPVVERFRREVLHPADIGSAGDTYLSPQVLILNQFLVAFSNFGQAGIGLLRHELDQATDPELQKWIVLALGMCRDSSIAKRIRTILGSDPDRYVRAVAIYALSNSMGQAAIPILQKYLHDKTVSEYYRNMDGSPFYMLRELARGQIASIESEAAHE